MFSSTRTDPPTLDTSYAIALSAPADLHHARAREIAARLIADDTRLITTHAVLLEIGNALSRVRHREAGISIIQGLRSDTNVEIVPITVDVFSDAVRLFAARPDKNWGLTDCTSFVVMRERGLTDALTADDHFRQAGFRGLLIGG